MLQSHKIQWLYQNVAATVCNKLVAFEIGVALRTGRRCWSQSDISL